MDRAPWKAGYKVGAGCDTLSGNTFGTVLTYDNPETNTATVGQSVVLGVSVVQSGVELLESLDLGGIGVLPGWFHPSPVEEFIREQPLNSYYTYILAFAKVERTPKLIRNVSLTPQASAVLQEAGWLKFEQLFGDMYVTGYVDGGYFIAFFEIMARRDEVLRNFDLSNLNRRDELQQLLSGLPVRIFVLTAGGDSPILPSTLVDVLEQLFNFPKRAASNPAVIYAIVESYYQSLRVPQIQLGPTVILKAQRNLYLMEMAREYLNCRDYKASLMHALEEFSQIEENAGLSKEELANKRQKYEAEIQRVSETLDDIVEKAQTCYITPAKCSARPNFVPAIELPSLTK